MNYSGLSQAIQDYCQSNETSFVAHIPDFVRQSELRLWQLLRSPDEQQVYNTGFIAPAANVLSAPISLIGVQAFYVASHTDPAATLTPLYPKEISWLNEAYPAVGTQGTPKYYALSGASVDSSEAPTTTFLVGPAADVQYDVTLYYFGPPQSIVTASTSWYGTFCPDALLFNALVEAYGYLKGEADMIQLYRDKANEAMQRAQRMVEGLQKQDVFRNVPLIRPIFGGIPQSGAGGGAA